MSAHLTLRFALESMPDRTRYVVGQDGLTDIEGGPGAGLTLVFGRRRHYVADWRISEYIREEPPPPEHRCPICSELFETLHSLKIHRGMKHRETRP